MKDRASTQYRIGRETITPPALADKGNHLFVFGTKTEADDWYYRYSVSSSYVMECDIDLQDVVYPAKTLENESTLKLFNIIGSSYGWPKGTLWVKKLTPRKVFR